MCWCYCELCCTIELCNLPWDCCVLWHLSMTLFCCSVGTIFVCCCWNYCYHHFSLITRVRESQLFSACFQLAEQNAQKKRETVCFVAVVCACLPALYLDTSSSNELSSFFSFSVSFLAHLASFLFLLLQCHSADKVRRPSSSSRHWLEILGRLHCHYSESL